MANNNVKNIQFLRNGNPAETRQLAIDALEAQKANVADGSIILARYGSGADIKTLAGLVYVNGDTKTVTIIDVEGASGDVQTLREEINAKLGTGVTSANTATAQLEALSGSTADTSATTSVEGAKRYADAKISELDYADTAVAGQYVTQVTEADGKIAVTRDDVSSAVLNNYSKGSNATAVAATDTINDAISKLENQIDAASGAIGTAISGLDYADTAVTGSYVSEVNETDGVISVSRVALPTVAAISETGKPITAVSESLGEISATAGAIEAQYVDVTDSGNLFSATTVEAVLAEIDGAYKQADSDLKDEILGGASESANTLGELEALINDISADAKEYHIVKTTTGLPETTKERYSLVDAAGNVSGDTIDVPKDSHIVSITYISDTGDTHYQNLKYEYIDVSGNTKEEYVDMSELVLEAEFDSGVTATNGVVHGVVDSASEKDSQSTPADFLTVGAGGFKVSGIKDEIDRKIAALDNTSDAAVEGQYITYITETDGIVSVGGREDIADAPLNGYTKGSDASGVTATDTINEAISKLENQIDAAEEAAAAAATVVEKDANTSHLTLSSTTDPTTSAVTYTIGEDDIASQTDLAELSAKTVTEIGSSNSSITVATAATTTDDGTVKYDVITDASKIKMSGFTADTSGFTAITEDSTVTEAVKAIETEFLANEATVSAALNDLEETKLETIIVNGVTGTTTTGANPSASVTIDGGNITLDGYEKPGTTTAITSADTVNQAIGKLEKGLEGALSGGITGITINSSGVTVSDNTASFTVEGATTAMTGSNNQAVVVDTDANGNLTIGLDTIDAGTY